MILLWGVPQDRPLVKVREALEERGAAYFFLDQARALETAIDLRVGAEASGTIQVGEEICDLQDVSAVYVRCHDSRNALPASHQTDDARHHAAALDDLVATWGLHPKLAELLESSQA